MDELALTIAALECGHSDLLGQDAAAVAERAEESGWRLARAGSGAPMLGVSDEGLAGQDLVVAPVEISEHRLATIGALLVAVIGDEGLAPLAGAGPVAFGELAAYLEARGRDGGHTLVGSLRWLARHDLVHFDEDARETYVGRALAAQPTVFFTALLRARDEEMSWPGR